MFHAAFSYIIVLCLVVLVQLDLCSVIAHSFCPAWQLGVLLSVVAFVNTVIKHYYYYYFYYYYCYCNISTQNLD